MALAQFAKKAVAGLGLRCGTPLLSEGGSSLRGLLGSRFYSIGKSIDCQQRPSRLR